jgi:hypothetical protein
MTPHDNYLEKFRKVEAFAITYQGEVVGRILFRHSGALCTCWVQVFGAAMVQGYARGFNYDKRNSAFLSALGSMRWGADAPRFIGTANAQDVPSRLGTIDTVDADLRGKSFEALLHSLGFGLVGVI